MSTPDEPQDIPPPPPEIPTPAPKKGPGPKASKAMAHPELQAFTKRLRDLKTIMGFTKNTQIRNLKIYMDKHDSAEKDIAEKVAAERKRLEEIDDITPDEIKRSLEKFVLRLEGLKEISKDSVQNNLMRLLGDIGFTGDDLRNIRRRYDEVRRAHHHVQTHKPMFAGLEEGTRQLEINLREGRMSAEKVTTNLKEMEDSLNQIENATSRLRTTVEQFLEFAKGQEVKATVERTSTTEKEEKGRLENMAWIRDTITAYHRALKDYEILRPYKGGIGEQLIRFASHIVLTEQRGGKQFDPETLDKVQPFIQELGITPESLTPAKREKFIASLSKRFEKYLESGPDISSLTVPLKNDIKLREKEVSDLESKKRVGEASKIADHKPKPQKPRI